MAERVFVVVPAFNERGWVSRVLSDFLEARRQGLVEGVVVVDDGSVDGTVEEVLSVMGGSGGMRDLGGDKTEIALRDGFLLRHPKNLGKTEAAITGVSFCRGKGADIVLFCDADMDRVPVKAVRKFLEHIVGNEGVDMARAGYSQGTDFLLSEVDPDLVEWSRGVSLGAGQCKAEYSGFRAVRVSALDFLFNDEDRLRSYVDACSSARREPGRGHGFGLEVGLEAVIPDDRKVEVSGLNLSSRRACGGSASFEGVSDDIRQVRRAITAANLNVLRTARRDEGSAVAGKSNDELGELARRLPLDEIAKLVNESGGPSRVIKRKNRQ